jgi:hypothetical protein
MAAKISHNRNVTKNILQSTAIEDIVQGAKSGIPCRLDALASHTCKLPNCSIIQLQLPLLLKV